MRLSLVSTSSLPRPGARLAVRPARRQMGLRYGALRHGALCLSVVTMAAVLSGCFATPTETPVRAPVSDLPPMSDVEELDGGEVTPPITGTCGMEAVQHYVGQARTSVNRADLPALLRVLGPNSVATMDYRPERMNVHVDASDIVTQITCG
ncbi:I78 family peptidase inhibitor [Maricaulis sp. D1M11]|uniref:I78 family peptidase inhibitor n=1 Tax=Maricaulis sp. D1M11 TaxID=3076117 RepID=UPI0039B6781F